ncbi:MAG: NfuA family Fe-S biogenesis protein [Candidatus Thioglobus sp.]|nr:NfuA family Fe-S biogenesis protein [Candidatus Thioglobus pontius]MBL6985039.1 NfuA family Fe-S biogenesis protein [Candidatus Thioglobus sp.]
MFTITDEAQVYVADLFAQQDDQELALKVGVEKAGTPAATVSFNFCHPKDLTPGYEKFEYQGFFAYIDKADFSYLEESEVALKDEGTGKKLTITAPNAKGEEPKEDAPLAERIRYVLAAEISPGLASHGGFVDLVEITDNNDVILNFGGGCQGCSSVAATLEQGVEAQLRARFPEIKSVRDQTDHSNTDNAYM